MGRSRRSGDYLEPSEAMPVEPEEVAQVDLTNVSPKAPDHGPEALVGLIRQEEARLVAPAVVDPQDKTHLLRVGCPNLLEGGTRGQNVPADHAHL